MELDRHVVGIVGGVEFGDVEKTLSSKAVAKVASEQGRTSVGGELCGVAILILSGDVNGLRRSKSCRERGEYGEPTRSSR